MLPTYRIIISPQAAADIQSIHDYISIDSPNHAAQMVGRILAGMESLRTVPHRPIFEHGKPNLKHPVRSLPVNPYVIYFRVIQTEQVVLIQTIRHSARRQPRKFE